MGDNASISTLHSTLLVRYYISLLRHTPQPPIIPSLERIIQRYRPDTTFFEIGFMAVSGYSKDEYKDLTVFYEAWRRVCKSGEEKVEAGMKWSEWLLGNGKAKEAARMVDVLKREVGGMRGGESLVGEVEMRRKVLLDEAESDYLEKKVDVKDVQRRVDAMLTTRKEVDDDGGEAIDGMLQQHTVVGEEPQLDEGEASEDGDVDMDINA